MKFTIKARLAAAFAVLAMLSGGQGIVSIVNMSRLQADLALFERALLPAIVAINQLQDATSEVRIKQYRVFALSDTPQELAITSSNTRNRVASWRRR